MEPSQTLYATLPQQHLTHAAEGCLRSEDLLLGGHEGANPHVGPRVASEVVDSATADILGLELWLLDGLHIILIVISCGIPVDADKFGTFCKDLAYKYVSVYDWHPMTVTIHKILIHGASIIDKTPLPIGMLSEQAAESRNKYWRSDREHHTRKFDRKQTMYDLFHRALVSSDPIIAAEMQLQRRKHLKKRPLPVAALALLKPNHNEKEFIDDMDDHEMLTTEND